MSTHLPAFIVLALASKAAASSGHTPVANLLPLVAAFVTLSPRYLAGIPPVEEKVYFSFGSQFPGVQESVESSSDKGSRSAWPSFTS